LHAQPSLVCPEIDIFQREVLGLPTTDPATAQKSDAATRACRDRLAGQGVNLAAYDTTQNAADIAGLRVALGIERWNVRGVSYGSDLACPSTRPARCGPAGDRASGQGRVSRGGGGDAVPGEPARVGGTRVPVGCDGG
jgi:pimeloyl-ACP methyl ester carboxylesterase